MKNGIKKFQKSIDKMIMFKKAFRMLKECEIERFRCMGFHRYENFWILTFEIWGRSDQFFQAEFKDHNDEWFYDTCRTW